MFRMLVLLLIAVVIVVGALFLLAGRAHERPQTTVEKVVPLGNLAN